MNFRNQMRAAKAQVVDKATEIVDAERDELTMWWSGKLLVVDEVVAHKNVHNYDVQHFAWANETDDYF